MILHYSMNILHTVYDVNDVYFSLSPQLDLDAFRVCTLGPCLLALQRAAGARPYLQLDLTGLNIS